MTRRSLRDRNTAAIAHDIVDVPVEPRSSTETPAPAPQDTPSRAAAEKPARKPAAKPAAAGSTARLGIYLAPSEFDDAKAAYLADWSRGGEADTFGRWIAAALDAHARRTPKQRAERGGLRTRSTERVGSTRSFSIPTETMQRMRAAITADQQAGRWPSDSAWAGEAIAIAVDVARDANGGTLPTPPARLPNRLAR